MEKESDDERRGMIEHYGKLTTLSHGLVGNLQRGFARHDPRDIVELEKKDAEIADRVVELRNYLDKMCDEKGRVKPVELQALIHTGRTPEANIVTQASMAQMARSAMAGRPVDDREGQ
ncbi:MAG: hypothetical protein ABSG31_18180 [Tepidisphaeraceae bacterium]|jgi:hypothetical protein